MCRPVANSNFESVKNNLPKQKALGPDGFIGELYQTFKEENIQIFYNFFHNIEAEWIFPNSFHETSTTQIPKPDKDITRKLQPMSLKNKDANNVNKILAYWIQQCIE